MLDCDDGDFTDGTGEPWEPQIKIHGDRSGFYTIKVDK
jgi:hypothetical protein